MSISFKPIYLFLVCFFTFGACQDVIDIDLDEGQTQLVIDAWLNDKQEVQVVKLRQTSPYFEAVASPAVTGAQVIITDSDGNTYEFLDPNNDGDYIWDPIIGGRFGTVGLDYTLSVRIGETEYTANSSMNRVPPVDSITFEDRESELGLPAGIYAQFFGRDFEGVGDCYWIKTFKNGSFLNKPQEINIAYDAGFTAGSEVDGLIFIPPIRELANRVADTGDDAVDNIDVAPWELGDSIHVEFHSITEEAFFYWERARIQLTLGDAAIFAEPPANVPTNISSSNPDENPQGFFNVAAVSSFGRKVE
ncbi:MAG: DUF4249 domain-containing protein [Bacteroidota bacterium]